MTPASEDKPQRLDELMKALHAVQLEKAEAYVASDWDRVWELTDQDIPRLEHEIALLSGSADAAAIEAETDGLDQAQPAALNFDRLSIELVEVKNSFFNTFIRRQSAKVHRVKVSLLFSDLQFPVVQASLLDHVIFYETRGNRPVKVSDLVDRPWISEPMAEWDANRTAENARQGINDLRLIIQERGRRRSD